MMREWRDAEGLPSDEVGSLALDDDGYLWVATTSGLARFDGRSFETVKIPKNVSSEGMAYGRIGAGGKRFVGITNATMNPEGGAVENGDGVYVLEDGDFHFRREPLLTGRNVRVVFFAPDDVLWLGCDDGALLRCEGEARQLFETPAGVSGRKIPSFATDGNGRVWVSIGTYVARFEKDGWREVAVEKKDGALRLGSSGGEGPWLMTGSAAYSWKADTFVEEAALPQLLGAHFIATSTEDRAGNLWIGTRSQGLFRIGGGVVLPVRTSSDEISALCHDRDGNLWVATDGGGLDRLRPRAHWLFDQGSGLKDNFSYTIAEDGEGAIWLANRDGGVARIRNGEVDPISRRAGWRPFSAMSVFPAKDGGMWITTGIGIFHTDKGDPAQVRRVPSLASTKLVRVSLVARNGDYWISLDPDRVGRWREGKLEIFGAADGFDGKEVRSIAEAADGTVWFAAAEGGLYRKNGDEAFSRVALPEELQPGSLQALSFEADGTLLVGTTRSGVLILPGGEISRLRILKTAHGLPSNNITGMLADDHGRYWFASRGGVFWVDRSQMDAFVEGRARRVHAVLLGRDDGVPDLSCQGLFQPSVWKAKDGTLWFATRRGVVNTNPALIAGESELPPVTLAEVKVDGRSRDAGERLVLSSAVRKTEFRFSVLNLTAPDRTVVRYQLEGFDDGWNLERNAVGVVYPRLPPGRYVLRAMASAGGGVWNEQPPLLTLVVVAPWWQSGWALVLYVLALIGVVVVVVRLWAHRRLRRRLERLEREQAVERERTRIARDIHDDLGASLTRISLLSQTTPKAGAEQAKVLEQIYETAHTITRSMDEIVWAVNPKFDDLEGLVYYIVNYAQKFLSGAGVRLRLEVPAALPAVSLTSQARHHLFLCCKEGLNNVVKHAGAEAVTLSVKVDGGVVRLAVADHGAGMGEGSATDSAARVSGGNGLKNMGRRMEEIGGRCEISRPAEGGTCVSFIVPLAANAADATTSGNP